MKIEKKIVIFSDTHGYHNKIQIPDGDILVFCGDMSKTGTLTQVSDFMDFFHKQPHAHKIFIAGNHDFIFETRPNRCAKLIKAQNIHYLNNSSVEIYGIKFWGSPVTPWFNDWAFNKRRGKVIRKYWDLIPQDTDILVTHGAPYGVLDRITEGIHTGCKDLLDVVNRVKPKYHFYGHIHEHRGYYKTSDTIFINASCMDVFYTKVFGCIDIIYDIKKTKKGDIYDN